MKLFKSILSGFVALSVTLASFQASAEISPHTMGKDHRVKHVLYNPTDVVRISVKPGVVTSIEFGAGERINQVLVGDSEAFLVEVLSSQTVLWVKPVVSRASTNMTVYTRDKVFTFVLTQDVNDTFRVVMEYPKQAPRTRVNNTVKDTGYEVSGNGDARPIRIWNDGRSTFFEFKENVRPAVLGVNLAGYEIPMNSTTRGNIVRVNNTRGEYALKMNGEVICVRRKAEPVYDTNLTASLAAKEF